MLESQSFSRALSRTLAFSLYKSQTVRGLGGVLDGLWTFGMLIQDRIWVGSKGMLVLLASYLYTGVRRKLVASVGFRIHKSCAIE